MIDTSPAPSGAEFRRVGVDILRDNVAGWWVTDQDADWTNPGLIGAIKVQLTDTPPSPTGNPYEWIAEVETVEGCISRTGVRRSVTVTP